MKWYPAVKPGGGEDTRHREAGRGGTNFIPALDNFRRLRDMRYRSPQDPWNHRGGARRILEQARGLYFGVRAGKTASRARASRGPAGVDGAARRCPGKANGRAESTGSGRENIRFPYRRPTTRHTEPSKELETCRRCRRQGEKEVRWRERERKQRFRESTQPQEASGPTGRGECQGRPYLPRVTQNERRRYSTGAVHMSTRTGKLSAGRIYQATRSSSILRMATMARCTQAWNMGANIPWCLEDGRPHQGQGAA